MPKRRYSCIYRVVGYRTVRSVCTHSQPFYPHVSRYFLLTNTSYLVNLYESLQCLTRLALSASRETGYLSERNNARRPVQSRVCGAVTGTEPIAEDEKTNKQKNCEEIRCSSSASLGGIMQSHQYRGGINVIGLYEYLKHYHTTFPLCPAVKFPHFL